MKGFGKSMKGTVRTVPSIRDVESCVAPANSGFGSSVCIAIQIKELMMFGALGIGVTHLYRIIKSIQPKKQTIKIIMGMHSNTKSVLFFSKMALPKRRQKP